VEIRDVIPQRLLARKFRWAIAGQLEPQFALRGCLIAAQSPSGSLEPPAVIDEWRMSHGSINAGAKLACTRNPKPPARLRLATPLSGGQKNRPCLPAAAAALRYVLRVVHQEGFAHAVIVEREVHHEPARVHVALLA